MAKKLNFCPTCGSSKVKKSDEYYKNETAICGKCSTRFAVVPAKKED